MYPVLLFKPKYRLGHPKKYLVVLSIRKKLGQYIQKNILFNFENRSTGRNQCIGLNINTGTSAYGEWRRGWLVSFVSFVTGHIRCKDM